MNTPRQNRFIQTKFILDGLEFTPLAERLVKKWCLDGGYTDALGNDAVLLVCLRAEL